MPTVNGTRWNDIVVSGSGAGYENNGVFTPLASNQSSATADTINTGNGDDYIEGLGGDDVINAGNGADEVFGGDGADDIIGGNGADELHGGAGDDQVVGGTGNDMLWGNGGADVLTGGNGDDTFVISDADTGVDAEGGFDETTGDVITDFRNGDTIDFGEVTLTGEGAPTGLTFTDEASEYGVWTEIGDLTTYVYADTDGDGVADIAFMLDDIVTLDENDFTGLGEQAGDSDVTAVNDTGTAVDEGVEEGSDAEGNVLENDVDSAESELSVVAVKRGGESGQGQAGSVGGSTAGTYGTLFINADGSYTYSINGSNGAVQALAAGQTLTETFTYTVQNADGDTDTAELTITIEGTNDAPRIQSGADGGSAEILVTEGDLSVTDVNAVDPDDGATLTYTIVGGADADLFSIDEETGELTFNEATDFDNPTDADGDGDYEVEVQVSDGLGGTDVQAYEVIVTDDADVVGDDNDFDDEDTAPTGFTPTTGTDGSDDFGGTRNQDAIFGGSGNDDLSGAGANDLLYGQGDDDTLDGGRGDDVLYGGSGDDDLTGGQGADELWGGSGDDVLDGGLGDDTFVGGLGADEMDGGSGADTFVFTTVDDSAIGFADTIIDFDSGVDTIDLSAFDIEAADISWTTVGQMSTVSIDTDGDGVADMEIMVQSSSLETTDFFL